MYFYTALYAVVDIETTGGRPSEDRIIEIAILITDGERIVDEFHSLVNPGSEIPVYITALTGIDRSMLFEAPSFGDIAQQIKHYLEGNVFVAHNVGFDYSFVKRELAIEDIRYMSKRLCTVRLSRKIFPGVSSYSLGLLCQSLGIPIAGRHRATGDAAATVELLHRLMKNDREDLINQFLRRKSGEDIVPPHLPVKTFELLPEKAGVYYFEDKKGNILYVGKAKNIKKRVTRHFRTELNRKNNFSLKHEIHHVSHTLTGNELVAYLLESHEIKRLQPSYNYAQRRVQDNYGVFTYEDRNGILHLGIDKTRKKHIQPLIMLPSIADTRSFLHKIVFEFGLCRRYCGLEKGMAACQYRKVRQCDGICEGEESPESYNEKVRKAMESIRHMDLNLLIIGKGRYKDEKSIVCCESGKFLGFGFVDDETRIPSLEHAKDHITQYPDNADIQRIIRSQIRLNKELEVIRC